MISSQQSSRSPNQRQIHVGFLLLVLGCKLQRNHYETRPKTCHTHFNKLLHFTFWFGFGTNFMHSFWWKFLSTYWDMDAKNCNTQNENVHTMLSNHTKCITTSSQNNHTKWSILCLSGSRLFQATLHASILMETKTEIVYWLKQNGCVSSDRSNRK